MYLAIYGPDKYYTAKAGMLSPNKVLLGPVRDWLRLRLFTLPHPPGAIHQQKMVFTGRVEAGGTFIVDRQVGDWSLPKSKLMATLTFMNNGRKLAPRLKEEAQRRG